MYEGVKRGMGEGRRKKKEFYKHEVHRGSPGRSRDRADDIVASIVAYNDSSCDEGNGDIIITLLSWIFSRRNSVPRVYF